MNLAPQNLKPLGKPAYGSIPHLLGSRRGSADRGVNDGQHRICTVKARDKFDRIIVQEKLDGSNVAIANIGGSIVPIGRAGYPCISSPHEQHRLFSAWVFERQELFVSILGDGERLCGEWLCQAHSTRYDLAGRCPFVVFDKFSPGGQRLTLDKVQRAYDWVDQFYGEPVPFDLPPLLHVGSPLSIDAALEQLGGFGRYGATDAAEGVVYRVERHEPHKPPHIDFLAKYVRPEKVDGRYFPENNGGEFVWNWRPSGGTP